MHGRQTHSQDLHFSGSFMIINVSMQRGFTGSRYSPSNSGCRAIRTPRRAT